MRIAKYLARCGVASRRKSEEVVLLGRIALNGTIITDLGRQVDPQHDQVTLDGEPVVLAETHLTLALYKTMGTVVTRSDPQGRQTVYDQLPKQFVHRSSELVYAGRLDIQTEGLLILSTDGDLIALLTHPRHHIAKTYQVRLNRPLSPQALDQLRQGVEIGDGLTYPAMVTELPGNYPIIELIIHEGRNRQIRRMIETVGGRVAGLERRAMGQLTLDELRLKRGKCCELSEDQISKLTAT